MAKKKTKIKLVKKLADPFVLTLLGAIVSLSILAWLRLGPQFKERQNQPWLKEKTDLIDKIEIKNNQEQHVLIKKEGRWLAASEDNLPADQDKVNQLLTSLAELKRDRLVSQNEKYHQKFGLDQENAIELKVFQGQNQLLHLLVGEPGPDFESDYLRLPDQKEVYLSNIAIRSHLTQPQWKNLKITKFYSDQIEKVVIQRDGQSEKEFDPEKAKDLINQLTGLQASDALPLKEEEQDQYGLNQSSLIITFKLKDNQPAVKLKLGKENDRQQRYCQRDNEKVVYLLPSWINQKIDQAVEQLFSAK